MGCPLADDILVFGDQDVKAKNALCSVLSDSVDVGTNNVLDKTAGRTVDR
jgi:hypothetical protein